MGIEASAFTRFYNFALLCFAVSFINVTEPNIIVQPWYESTAWL